MSNWFSLKVVVRQGCVMSPWNFHLYVGDAEREMQARILGKETKWVMMVRKMGIEPVVIFR